MIIASNLISFDFNEAKTIILSIEFVENNNFNLSWSWLIKIIKKSRDKNRMFELCRKIVAGPKKKL